ncbi:hypothetical protein NG798_24215 [Ancylothrix sp. C2]|nr:hypothetical protein [Ancylothrix sp. D3o]
MYIPGLPATIDSQRLRQLLRVPPAPCHHRPLESHRHHRPPQHLEPHWPPWM